MRAIVTNVSSELTVSVRPLAYIIPPLAAVFTCVSGQRVDWLQMADASTSPGGRRVLPGRTCQTRFARVGGRTEHRVQRAVRRLADYADSEDLDSRRGVSGGSVLFPGQPIRLQYLYVLIVLIRRVRVNPCEMVGSIVLPSSTRTWARRSWSPCRRGGRNTPAVMIPS